YWSDTGGHNELLGSSTVGEEIRLFFDSAREVRVAGVVEKEESGIRIQESSRKFSSRALIPDS
ncbi:MAG: hypothetical protein AAF743_10965, partial [Planctomycetota bacterium]